MAERRWNTSGREAGWDKIAARVLRLAGGICQFEQNGIRCVSLAKEADHIIPVFEGGTDDPSNLWALCSRHHGTKTADEGHRAWESKKESMRKKFTRTEKHPGEI